MGFSQSDEDVICQLSLTQIQGVGNVNAKSLIAYCGSAKNVFKQTLKSLENIPGIGKSTAKTIKEFDDFEKAKKEIDYLKKYKIKNIFYLDKEYPTRLKNCEDAPLNLFYKGNAELNNERVISIVGTRKSTPYGKQVTEAIIERLKPYNVLIVSGLASGTDTNAHKISLQNNLQTIGVLGHGLNTMFPSENKDLAKQMLKQGGLLTEFWFEEAGLKENFPKRNRIVAGMCDATLVIESGETGGSLITAFLARDYNRDVFAVPGKIKDTYSKGCNMLIRKNIAAIIDSPQSLIEELGYDLPNKKKSSQPLLLPELSENELLVINHLKLSEKAIDELHFLTKLTMSQLALILLDLEFKGLVNSLPGKVYCLS